MGAFGREFPVDPLRMNGAGTDKCTVAFCFWFCALEFSGGVTEREVWLCMCVLPNTKPFPANSGIGYLPFRPWRCIVL